MGFGASPLGGVFGHKDEAEAIRAVRVALDAGINYLDVAPFYGLTRAETTLGKALEGVPRGQYVLSSKVGRYGQNDFDFSAPRVVQSIEDSLRRLKTDHLDIAICHDIEYVPFDVVLNEAIPTLQRLRVEGKVRWIGISGLPLAIYPRLFAAAKLDVILSYCHYTLYDTTLTSLLPLCETYGVGVINASPYGMGLLTDRSLPDWHPAPQPLRDTCQRAKTYCQEQGIPLASLALPFSLSEPRIATTLVGMGNSMEVQQNLAWYQQTPNTEVLRKVMEIFEPVRGMTWQSGLAENQ